MPEKYADLKYLSHINKESNGVEKYIETGNKHGATYSCRNPWKYLNRQSFFIMYIT